MSTAAAQAVLVAHYKIRPGADLGELRRIGERMWAVAREEPGFGFRSGRYLTAGDGSPVAMYEFDDLAGLERFRLHPEHLAVQRRWPEFFEWMRNDVCTVVRRDTLGAVPL
ncbi:MAG TPA: hypothetical protein VGS06_11265 [Streptosporangiaceae bacterium]|nr:hypothetical protein [Streptosporangiaceae bacterium]